MMLLDRTKVVCKTVWRSSSQLLARVNPASHGLDFDLAYRYVICDFNPSSNSKTFSGPACLIIPQDEQTCGHFAAICIRTMVLN